MRNFIIIMLFSGCVPAIAEMPDQKDKEFEQLLAKSKETITKSIEVQSKIEDKQKQLIEQAVTKITTLKTEVNTLKIELKDVKEKLDSIDADTGIRYNILPISNHKIN